MKFQPDHLDGVNAISRYEVGKLWVHQTPFDHSVLVPWQGAVQSWPIQTPETLRAEHFEAVRALNPELVILGTGPRQKFIEAQHCRALFEHRVGLEIMDTAAACRTFNVLVHEGRRVVAALLI